jgi:penicillin amidase
MWKANLHSIANGQAALVGIRCYHFLMRRRLTIFAGAILLLVAIGAAAGYVHLRRSLPVIDGELSVAGISSAVEIIRDADNIPHIFAASKLDAFFGLGYVHAQDRLWQMEFQRRIGHGRLSEIFGQATVAQDRFLRTVGFGRAARSAWERLPADTRRELDAYVAGVNAFIAGGRLPPEFSLLWFEPEPWSGPDVLAWVKMMAWDLSANYSHELMRYDMLAKVGPERTADLLPDYPAHGLSIVPGGGRNHDVGQARAAAPSRRSGGVPPRLFTASSRPAGTRGLSESFTRALSTGDPRVSDFLLLGARGEAFGSNNWVVDGTLSASGKPLLANDPHLGASTPSLWYLAHMSAGEFEVIGATLPGAPAVAIGRNRFIAWGETNVAADVQDLYLERIDAAGRNAEFRGAWEPLRRVEETIAVKGGDPVHVDVRISRHGPLVSDAINANNASSDAPRPDPWPPLAFRWTALDDEDTTILAFLRVNEARNWGEFTSALRDLVVPAQNFVYGDVDGHIGYYAPGRVPIRANHDGAGPAEGWTGQMEWTGFVPFDELPHLYDPPEHFIVTANHRPAPPDYPHPIALEYPEPYRAQRIIDLIRGATALAPDSFRRIQADTISLHAKTLVPILLRHVRTGESRTGQALALLRQWDFDSRADSAAATIFQAWFHQLPIALASDELGPLVFDSYNGRFSYITRFIINTLVGSRPAWCDDVNTRGTETCEDAVTAALTSALDQLTSQLGSDMAAWRWDRAHPAVFPHQGLDTVPGLRPLLSRSRPSQGDWSTVNVGAVDADTPFEQHSVPGYRQIVDLSPRNDSRFLDAVGQSGHFLSKHYDDFLDDWRAVRHRKMRMDRPEISDGALGVLVLQPRLP